MFEKLKSAMSLFMLSTSNNSTEKNYVYVSLRLLLELNGRSVGCGMSLTGFIDRWLADMVCARFPDPRINTIIFLDLRIR